MKKFFLYSSKKNNLVNLHFKISSTPYIKLIQTYSTFSFFFDYITLIFAQKHYRFLLNEKKK